MCVCVCVCVRACVREREREGEGEREREGGRGRERERIKLAQFYFRRQVPTLLYSTGKAARCRHKDSYTEEQCTSSATFKTSPNTQSQHQLGRLHNVELLHTGTATAERSRHTVSSQRAPQSAQKPAPSEPPSVRRRGEWRKQCRPSLRRWAATASIAARKSQLTTSRAEPPCLGESPSLSQRVSPAKPRETALPY